MSAETGAREYILRKLDFAVRQIRRNISAFSPEDLEDMVRHKLIDASAVPAELRTPFVRHKLRLTK